MKRFYSISRSGFNFKVSIAFTFFLEKLWTTLRIIKAIKGEVNMKENLNFKMTDFVVLLNYHTGILSFSLWFVVVVVDVAVVIVVVLEI